MIDLDKINKRLQHGQDFVHISYKEKIEKAARELLDTNPNEVIRRGREEWDNVLGGLFGGKLYLIGAETGTGKSTFINQVCNNVADQGYRVVKYSLEDRMEDIGKEELYYMCNRLYFKDTGNKFKRTKFVCGEYNENETFLTYLNRAYEKLSEKTIVELDKQKDVTIDNLTMLMEEEAKKGAKLFAIDHLHYFQYDDANRLDLQIKNVMHRINEVARMYNVAVILVAHYKNNTGWEQGKKPNESYFRDGSAIKQVANIIIQITREDEGDEQEISKFYLTKLRGPIKKHCFETTFDLAKYEYRFKKSEYKKKNDVSIPGLTIT